uniref:Uncharacterized protein n=1 Tax=Heterorhabditis bacteriophora TaxID=37862 RepID=A0A1I7WC25_HETBA
MYELGQQTNTGWFTLITND